MTETPRDVAYRLLSSEAWREDTDQIIRECGVGIPAYGGETEALDRAFMAGVETALADAARDEPVNPMWDDYKERRDDLRRKHAIDGYQE